MKGILADAKANEQRVLRDRLYAEAVANRLLEFLFDIDSYRGSGRLYLPWSWVSRFLGNPAGNQGAGGPATAAGLARPHGCGLDAAGNLYIADTHNHRVRVVGL
jgi:NHL repeat-containing protein